MRTAEPVVNLDLDIVVVMADLVSIEDMLRQQFTVERFPHSVNISAANSDLRVQIQTDPRYASFLDRTTDRVVLGVKLPVAAMEDVLQGKIWAAEDPARPASKRQKDLADIARLLEARPALHAHVPDSILQRLL